MFFSGKELERGSNKVVDNIWKIYWIVNIFYLFIEWFLGGISREEIRGSVCEFKFIIKEMM